MMKLFLQHSSEKAYFHLAALPVGVGVIGHEGDPSLILDFLLNFQTWKQSIVTDFYPHFYICNM